MARWWLIGGGAALGALLIASIALALTNRPADFAPGTPEAAVQALLRAAAADDFDAAYRLLASELRADCSQPQFAATHEGYGYRYSSPDIQARLDNARIADDAAFVAVKITEYYSGGIYGGGESSRSESYSLRRENGDWKFTTYPYPYDYCNPRAPAPSPLPTRIPTSTPIPVQ